MAKHAKQSSKTPLEARGTSNRDVVNGTAHPDGTQPGLPPVAFTSQALECGLYVVATPIGNLMDMTFRAVDVLQQVDLIACEDTRVTGKLLRHFGIKTDMLAYNDHNGAKVRPQLLAEINAGKSIALVSDAGTPLISDPGYKLVGACADKGVKVIPVPGASALLAGLVAAALPTDRVMFVGFLPPKQKARQSSISSLAQVNATIVFYETGPRLGSTLTDMAEHLGPRPAVVGRELTKLYEEVRRGTLEDLVGFYGKGSQIKGEIVIVVGPPLETESMTNAEIDAALKDALDTLSVRDAAAAVAETSGQPRRQLYARALALKTADADDL